MGTTGDRYQLDRYQIAHRMSETVGPLKFGVKNSVLTFQPQDAQPPASPLRRSFKTLRVDLKDGSMGTSLAEPLPPDSPVALGIIGMLKLHGGSVIALVSKAKQVPAAAEASNESLCH